MLKTRCVRASQTCPQTDKQTNKQTNGNEEHIVAIFLKEDATITNGNEEHIVAIFLKEDATIMKLSFLTCNGFAHAQKIQYG